MQFSADNTLADASSETGTFSVISQGETELLPQIADDDAAGVTHERDVIKTLDLLYEKYPLETVTAMSRQERKENNYKSSCLVYGEISFSTFVQDFRRLYDKGLAPYGGKFIDLGCGTGKAIFAAALIHNFEVCVGIELLQTLHDTCTEVLHKWKRMMIKDEDKQRIEFQFIHGDITVIDWSDGDVIFAHSTCFDDDLMDKLSKLAEKTRPGTFILTTTNRINSDEFTLIEVQTISYHWGEATLFVQRRN